MLGRIRCMVLFIDLIILLHFGPVYGNIRECDLSLFASNIPNWFVEIVSVLMVSFYFFHNLINHPQRVTILFMKSIF